MEFNYDFDKLKSPNVVLTQKEKAIFREHAYKYEQNKKILKELPFPMELKNKDSSVVHIDEEDLDNYYKVTRAAYYNLYYAVFWEEKEQGVIQDVGTALDITSSVIAVTGLVMNFIPLIGQIGSLVCEILSGVISAVKWVMDAVNTKTRTYPSQINLIHPIIQNTLNLTKISIPNQKVIMQGVENYIEMQKEEYDDFYTEDEYVYLSSLLIYAIVENVVPNFYNTIKKVLVRKDQNIAMQAQDLYPQAAGKDTTNEIDFAKEPARDVNEEAKRRTSESKSEGATLDYARNRHSSEHAGGDKYDYEFSKVGFDIELTKAQEIDNRGIYAHNAIIAQMAKSFALTLSSMHYCWKYQYKLGATDICIVKSHIVTDMKVKEINPSIIKFNNESKYKAQQARLNRYNQGYQPDILRDVVLDLIDESVKAYYRQWLRLYSGGFTGDYIEYDEERNFLYFKDVEREVKVEYETKDSKPPQLQYSTMQLLIIYERGKLGSTDSEGEFSPYPDIALLTDYESREYFEDSDEENSNAPLYFEVRSEYVSVELVGVVHKTYQYGDGMEGVETYNKYAYTYKLTYNKRIYKSTLLKEISKAQAKKGEADKEQTNLDKLQQGGYI